MPRAASESPALWLRARQDPRIFHGEVDAPPDIRRGVGFENKFELVARPSGLNAHGIALLEAVRTFRINAGSPPRRGNFGRADLRRYGGLWRKRIARGGKNG